MGTASHALNSLPVELQQQILSRLPLPSLLTFARTSKHNYYLSTTVLTTLHLAVFPKRIHGILAFLNASPTSFLENPSVYQVAVPTQPNNKDPATISRAPRSLVQETTQIPTNPQHHLAPSQHTDPVTTRHKSILSQNALLTTLLSCPTLANLHTLTIHTTALLSPSAASLLASTFPDLRDLTLNFSHPYVHDTCLPAKYWTTAPDIPAEGTPAWNALAGIGEENEASLRLSGLSRLEVVRAAMTGRQVGEWIRRNKRLRCVRLCLVTGVDKDLVEALGDMAEYDGKRDPVRRLAIEECPDLKLREERDFEWIDKLVEGGLREASLKGCAGVDGEVLLRTSEKRRWEDKGLEALVLPEDGEAETMSLAGEVERGAEETDWKEQSRRPIEVDPEYL